MSNAADQIRNSLKLALEQIAQLASTDPKAAQALINNAYESLDELGLHLQTGIRPAE
jgi:hypothetical protein